MKVSGGLAPIVIVRMPSGGRKCRFVHPCFVAIEGSPAKGWKGLAIKFGGVLVISLSQSKAAQEGRALNLHRLRWSEAKSAQVTQCGIELCHACNMVIAAGHARRSLPIMSGHCLSTFEAR
mmetsp:Transcript_110617/g.312829  ORF Transcript_110617/g.312829 Transcript_110617/m.312829 type:complete len:121 (+) Transcript_110617:795-1157(+)